MFKVANALSLSLLALLVASCSPPADDTERAENPGEEVPVEASEAVESATTAEEPVPTPEIRVRRVAGLRASTDPEEFVASRGEEPGRGQTSGPFVAFPVAMDPNSELPPVDVPDTEPAPKPAPVVGGSPQPAPAPPPEPTPTIAPAIEVSGTVQVGNRLLAIIKAPNEQSSRYVLEGQYVANGQVLVKRIDINRPTPAIVFEEIGEEVVKTVSANAAMGETGVSLPSLPTPTALAPLPPPPPSAY